MKSTIVVGVGAAGRALLAHLNPERTTNAVLFFNPEDAGRLAELLEESCSQELAFASLTQDELYELAIKAAQADYSPKLPLVRVSRGIDRATVENILSDPSRLYAVSPANFEAFIAEIYRGIGYKVTLTKASHDEGVDIFVERSINGMLHRYAIQCKHTKSARRKIGVSYARDLLGVTIDKCVTAGILITNALFSRPTRDFIKRHASRLFSVDAGQLSELMKEYVLIARVKELVA